MFARFVEHDVLPTFLRQPQIHAVGGEVGEVAACVDGEVACVGFFKFRQFFLSSHDTQRADQMDALSNTASTPYSLARREVTTSNCNTPTAPKIKSAPLIGLNT